MKKLISLILCLALLGAFPIISYAASGSNITPFYNNTIKTTVNFVINESGNATVDISYIGYSGIMTAAKITTKIQKLESSSWADVSIGTADNTWVDESTNFVFSTSHSVGVSRGTYRAVVTFEISGTGGATDVITRDVEYTY